ncbi:hypothetical protein SAMN02745136_02244 [Anaerocolumna jejuensis DSM 15929]|jgi:hypothetical protein|uniref:Uncharacterized protein n=1 Tax=Anaerocolumna jejuensis DSM 15929 TaxID=1121322 RepID=A0A1M6RNM2_9FIRM|nr:hypothetical protein [Anaerocolumna jejuensis]SHK34063.1 hypothetical protein SAMN02745136_02244 [Anaerocolumna jejuensis DSM 15929]
MENVIGLLHDIEEKANLIIARANDEKVKLHEALKNDLEKLDKDVADSTNAKLLVLKNQVSKELAAEKEAITKDWEKQLADLEANYTMNHDMYVDKIIQEIISE